MNEWFIISMKYLKYKYIINPTNVKKKQTYILPKILRFSLRVLIFHFVQQYYFHVSDQELHILYNKTLLKHVINTYGKCERISFNPFRTGHTPVCDWRFEIAETITVFAVY